jgi:hypothetical protein
MSSGYYILAVSDQAGTRLREIALEDGNHDVMTNAQMAQERADSFALLCNNNKKLDAEDWKGVIEYMQLGLDTLVYNGHLGPRNA